MTTCITEESKNAALPADFQTAIAATGFGKYNILLILICIPAAWSTQFESTIISFIIPAAACDLELSPSQKGLLNSVAMIGMISTSFIWGVLIDTLGRRKLLIVAFIIEGLIVFGKSLAQEFIVLSVLGFFGGSITGGTYIALNTFLLEFHSTEYRSKVQMIYGMMFCGANIIIPLLSSAILPLKFHLQVSIIDFYAWNLLILLTSTSSIISAICFCFLPESPKFLMSIGNNVEALEVFRTVYKHNYGRPAESYPIDYLINEISEKLEPAANTKSWTEYIKTGWDQMTPLFGKTYGPKLLQVSIIQSTLQMAMNSIRFYLPQIFQAIHEYQVAHNGSSSNICDVLDILRAPKEDEEYVCTVNLENSFRVYLNSVIVATVTLITYAMAGTLINLFGKKPLLVALGISASLTCSFMYFSNGTAATLSLSSLYLSACAICFDLFVTVIMVTFPTTLRAMAFSICLLFGRLLTVVGNMVFPMLVEIGCAPPFFTVGTLNLVAAIFVSRIPNMDKVDMK